LDLSYVRIRQLCAEAVAAKDHAALHTVLSELQAAIKEHVHNARMTAAEEIHIAFKPISDAA
jgi:hypothetical protein